MMMRMMTTPTEILTSLMMLLLPLRLITSTYTQCTCTDRCDSDYANESTLSDHKDDLFNNDADDGDNANPNDKDSKVEVTLCKMISVSSDHGPHTANDHFTRPAPLYPPLPSPVAIEADPGVCWTNPLPVNCDTLAWVPLWSKLDSTYPN